MIPEATSATPKHKRHSAAASSGFSNVMMPRRCRADQARPRRKNLPPGLELECVDDLGHAGDDHHDADDEDAYDRRKDDAGERDQPGNNIDHAERTIQPHLARSGSTPEP